MQRFIRVPSASHTELLKASNDIRDHNPPPLDASEADWKTWTHSEYELLVRLSSCHLLTTVPKSFTENIFNAPW